MTESEEEFVMDFKAEERTAQLFHLEDNLSDCSTLSASEIDGYGNDPMPPPFSCKLKKVRVLIKKLPGDILKKYKISCKGTPLRSSGRIKDKHIPAGQYLALHKNKPLHKLKDSKRLQGKNVLNFGEKSKFENQSKKLLKKNILSDHSFLKRNLKSNLLSDSIFKPEDVTTPKIIPNKSYPLHSGRLSCNKFEAKFGKIDNENKASLTTTTKNVDKRNAIPSNSYRSLHERIAATRIKHKPIETSNSYGSLHERIAATRIKQKPTVTYLPKLQNVVIPRHNVLPISRHHFANEANVANSSSNSRGRNTLQNEKTSVPYVTSLCPQNSQSRVFPTFITPAPAANQSRNLMPSNVSSGGLQRHSLPNQRKFTIQAFKIPNDSTKSNEPIPVASPRIFVVNQSLLEREPLNAGNLVRKITKQSEIQIEKENTTDNASEICFVSDSDVEQTDVEKQVEPEVIKRIIYHTKSVQTKFTCNGSICGLVDSEEFNLNCFYCYEIFPLHKWLDFKEHIKHVHKVEEGSELSDSDVDLDNSFSRSLQENCSDNFSSTPRYMNENDKRSFTTKDGNPKKPVYKKLPLEPRLLIQRQNKIPTEACKIFSSTPKISKPSKIIAPSGKYDKNLEFSNSKIDEIINLDSDDSDRNIGKPDAIKKTSKIDLQVETKATSKTAPSDIRVAQISDSKIIVPTLPHITIKKVSKALPNEKIDAPITASEPALNEKFIEIPSTTNIEMVIKTLPKPTANQLPAANGNTKPKYFVVKKIIKLPPTDQVPKASNLNIPEGSTLTKMPKSQKSNGYNIEDSVPKPKTGLGILFGLTNSMVVIEFLLKLKTFPELWRYQEKNNAVKYNDSLKKLCSHINNRFDLNMTEFEMFLSIQRVKDWYYLMLQSIREHNKDPNNTEPYKHRFPIYFKILSQYLKPDADEKGIRLNEIISKTALAAKASAANINEKASLSANETRSRSFIENFHSRRSSTISANSPSIEQSQNQEFTPDSLIEFDADTLYGEKSSEEETCDEFDKFFKTNPNKKTATADGTQRRRTKVYIGRFECDICHKVYKRNCDLKRHRVLHYPPQFECSRCSQKFYFKHWADRCAHDKNRRGGKYKKVDKASGEKRIWPKKIFRFCMICEICGNSYRSIGSLNTHKRDKHLNQRNTCIVCNFTALSNWRIVQHQRKRHIVEPGLPEEVAKKSRARTESKSSFSNEARQAFDWRREMRKKMKPGEKFYGCCRCKIIFNTRKEKVLHNKIEHPITEYTVICLLCLPNKLLLSNSNCARRHYTDIHKVPWHEIDGLVRCTKPIFNLLNKEEIELLKASENYKELLDELLKDKKLQSAENIQILEDEASKAVQNLPQKALDVENTKIEVECTQEENLYVDGIIDNDNYSESNYKQIGYASINEHNYSEDVMNETFSEFDVLVANSGEDELYSRQQSGDEVANHMNADIESNECTIENYIQDDQEYVQSIVGDFIEGELTEENIVVEEYIDEVICEDEVELI